MNRSLLTNIVLCSFTGSFVYAQALRFFRKSDYYDNVYVKYEYLQDYFNSGFVLGGATALVLNYLQKPTTPLITNN